MCTTVLCFSELDLKTLKLHINSGLTLPRFVEVGSVLWEFG